MQQESLEMETREHQLERLHSLEMTYNDMEDQEDHFKEEVKTIRSAKKDLKKQIKQLTIDIKIDQQTFHP